MRAWTLSPLADIVASIKKWEKTGLQAVFFDAIAAFEVIEHVDMLKEAHALLKRGGKLFLPPHPLYGLVYEAAGSLGLNQKRTSPHCNLAWPEYKCLLSQWAIFTK